MSEAYSLLEFDSVASEDQWWAEQRSTIVGLFHAFMSRAQKEMSGLLVGTGSASHRDTLFRVSCAWTLTRVMYPLSSSQVRVRIAQRILSSTHQTSSPQREAA